ncbi:MAG: zinc-ribbon domain-containing protein [Patescibacteria group bacterium]|jgi:hypothetical protein
MICNNCNKEISQKSKFCRYCGVKLEAIPVETMQRIPELTQDTIVDLESKRNKWLGWVLLIFSILGFVVIGLTTAEGTEVAEDSISSFGNSPLPYIIDFYLGIQLIRQKSKYLNWVLTRAVIGLLLWGLIAIADQKWGEVVSQAVYCSYFVYLIKAPLAEKSLKISNYILLPLSIILSFFA